MEDEITGDWEIQSIDEHHQQSDGNVSELISDEFLSEDDLLIELPLTRDRTNMPVPETVHAPPSCTLPPVQPTSATFADNEYLGSIQSGSGLHLGMETRVRKAFEEDGLYGLFTLLVTVALRQSIRGWASTKLEASGKKSLAESELNAYIGLEIAMSLCPLNDIADYWSTDRFLGQPVFIETMTRDRFQCIRGALQFHPPESVTYATVRDPLYRCRKLLQHFQKRFAETAVPIGASSLEEISVRTKARSRAKTYMSSKPDKYGLRFYAVVGWDALYAHSVWDNGSGNITTSTPAERYTQLFPSLRTPLYNTLHLPEVNIDPNSATALWVAMAGHQTRTFRSPSGRRLLVSDNFYTRHTYARAFEAFTDGEVRLLGTVRLNLVDKFNKFALEPAVERISNQKRGLWELVAAVDPERDYKENAAAHDKKQKKRPKHLRTEYMPTLTYAEHAGCIVFKDRKVVVFYTNDLKSTMSARSLPSTSPEAVSCCHGTVPIMRWTGETIMNRKALVAPALIALYNQCMNAVDRVD